MEAYTAGIQGLSTIDYPKKISTVIFLAGCNLRCKYCFNSQMLETRADFRRDLKEITRDIAKNLPILDAIVFSGGEPLLQEEAVVEISNWARDRKLNIGIETNGTKPQTLKRLLDSKLLDFVAVDVKAPFERYEEVTQKNGDIVEKVVESIGIIRQSKIEHEFRTTFVPRLVDMKDIKNIGKIVGQDKWAWQKFRHDLGEVLDKQLLRRDFSAEEIKKFRNLSKKYKNVILRF